MHNKLRQKITCTVLLPISSRYLISSLLSTPMSKKHLVVLLSNHHTAMYFSYCKSALSLARYRVSKYYIMPGKTLYLLLLDQVKEGNYEFCSMLMPLGRLCILQSLLQENAAQFAPQAHYTS